MNSRDSDFTRMHNDYLDPDRFPQNEDCLEVEEAQRSDMNKEFMYNGRKVEIKRCEQGYVSTKYDGNVNQKTLLRSEYRYRAFIDGKEVCFNQPRATTAETLIRQIIDREISELQIAEIHRLNALIEEMTAALKKCCHLPRKISLHDLDSLIQQAEANIMAAQR